MNNKIRNPHMSLIIIFIITILAIAIGFGVDLSIYLFVNCLMLIVLPLYIRDIKLSLVMKIFISLWVGIICVLAIYYFVKKAGLIKVYTVVYIIAILGNILIHYKKK